MSVVLSEHLPLLATAPDGIQKLRGLILELAVRGKLVPQDPEEEPVSELLKRIAKERARLEAEGTCKRAKQLPPVGETERRFTLPVGWKWVSFGDATICRDGERIPVSQDERNLRAKVFDYYGASGVIDKIDNYLFDKPLLLIGEDGANLVNRSTPIAFIARGKYWVNNHAHVLDGISESFLRYIELFINAIDLKPYVTGTAQPKMNQAKMNGIPVALPPEAEQHRIVAKVDELMALCDRLEADQTDAVAAHAKLVETLLDTLTQSTNAAELAANWQRLAEHFDTLFTTESSLDALKQTILQLAVMGKLVPQEPKDEPASELLKRVAKERARLEVEGACKKSKPLLPMGKDQNPFAIPESWVWARLSEVTKKITDGTHHSPPNLPSGDFKYISAKNIKPWGIELSGMTFVTEAIHNEIFSRCNPEFGDVLYIKDGATTGIAAINTLTEPFSMLSSVALLKPSIGLFNRYLYFLMTSPFFYDEMRAGMTGVAITRVTLAKLNVALLPLPPLAEQYRIVAKVDELLALCDRLKADLAESRTRQARLSATLIESALQAA